MTDAPPSPPLAGAVRPPDRAGGYLCLLSAITLFSTIEVVSKGIGGSIPPLRLAAMRFLLSGLALLPAGIVSLRRRGRPLGARDWGTFARLGLIGVTVSIGLFHGAIRHLPANVSAIVFSVNPVFVVLFAAMLLRERLDARKLGGVALGVAGVALFVWQKGGLRAESAAGVGLMSGSLLAFALNTVHVKRHMPDYGALAITSMSGLFGSAFLLPVSWAVEGAPWASAPAAAWYRLLYLGLAGTALAYALYFAGLRRVEASRGSLVFFLKPALASLLAWALLGETLTPTMWAGTALIVSALFCALWPGRALAVRRR